MTMWPKLAVVAAMLITACRGVNTDPSAVASVELKPFASPSVIVGDTLRDTLGVVQPIHGIAFNIQDDSLSDVPIRYRALDTGLVVDSITGIVFGRSITNTPVRLIAEARGLQTQMRTVTVVPEPENVVAINAVDSIFYAFSDTSLLSSPLELLIWHGTGVDSVPVQAYLASFTIQAPSPSPFAELVGDNGVSSFIDTTGTDGKASRRIRLRPRALVNEADSVVVLGTVKLRGSPLAGSPVRFVLHIRPKP